MSKPPALHRSQTVAGPSIHLDKTKFAGPGRKGKNTVMASHGRAPWYTPDGKPVPAYVIGIAGGSASGKTSVARAILSSLGYIPTVLILSQDAFYRAHSAEELEMAFRSDFDFDHPDAIDTGLFAKCLQDLKQGKATEIPVYSFVHHQRMPEKKYIYGASVIIVEGIMALQSAEMRELYDLKVFVTCDSDLMLARRIRRDVKERGRDVDGILDQYLRFVKSNYDNFVQPSSKFADIIVPGYSNQLAIELLVTHIKGQLDSRSLRFRNMLARLAEEDSQSPVSPNKIEEGVVVLEQTPQLLGIMTILRDQETERGDFIFYADRLSTLIVEKALTLLPYESHTVTTPLNISFEGKARARSPLVGVSILRSGGPFSHGLRRVIRDVQIGAMLIQSDPKTGEPLLLSSDLPQCIKNGETSEDVRVLLLDSQMGTGAAAMMGIRVLLDHGIPESNIIFLAFLISRHGLSSVRRAFPRVQIVTAAIDPELHEMHLPLHNLIMGEAAGEADFAVRVINPKDVMGQSLEGEGQGDGNGGANNAAASTAGKGVKEERDHEEEHLRDMERLKFSRQKKEVGIAAEKRAWVVSPGMGHIGDRYYSA